MPTDLQDLAPFDIDEVLSPSWLSTALGRDLPGVVVSDTEVVEVLESTARKVRFTVAYDDTGGHQDLPTALCVKGYFNPDLRQFGVTGLHEVRYYDRLADIVPIRAPRPRYTGINTDETHGLVIMDDVVAAGSTFFYQLDYYPIETARRSLHELARLHGQFWEHDLKADAWLAPKIRKFPGYIPTDVMDELLAGPRGDGFPDRMRDAARLKTAMNALADRYATRPRTLIHADAHLGNLFRTPDDRIGFVDWQNYEFGHWSIDVAYHVATALDPAHRAEQERELLGFYLERLAEEGGPLMSFDDAWEDYCVAPAYGYFLWAMTRRVVPHITEELTQRLGKSVLDNDSLDLLGV